MICNKIVKNLLTVFKKVPYNYSRHLKQLAEREGFPVPQEKKKVEKKEESICRTFTHFFRLHATSSNP